MDYIINTFNAKVISQNKQSELSGNFKKLKTDEERVKFTLNIMSEYDIIPTTTGIPKSTVESVKLRKEGNLIFTNSNLNAEKYVDAMKLYTKSIAFAPCPSKELALAYANRSAVLFNLGLHLDCISDIERALALNYPDTLRAKLCVRKVECLVILKNYSWEKSLKEAEYWIDQIPLNDPSRRILESKLSKLKLKLKPEIANPDNSNETRAKAIELESESILPSVTSENDEVPCASDAVAINYDKHYGRHVIATRDIYPGEVIAVEKPYALILMHQNMQTHCSNCLNVSWANIPCNFCTYAMYCSETCKFTEWYKCHSVECGVFSALLEHNCNNNDLFSVRLAIFAMREAGGINKLRIMLEKFDKCNDPRTKGFSEDGKLHSNKYSSIYNLVTNTERRTIPELFRRSLQSCFALYFLATRSVIFSAKLPEDINILAKNDDITFLGGLILRHQQIIPSNAHCFSEIRNGENAERGIAAMPFLSLINHSCNPNISRHSRSEQMVVYAIHPIRKGEQIFDNYGQHYALMERTERQHELYKLYCFFCDCSPCQEDWPLYEKLWSYEILVKTSEIKTQIENSLQELVPYMNLILEDNIKDKPKVMKSLMQMIDTLYNFIPMPFKEICDAVETLKHLCDTSGNMFVMPQIWPY